MKWLVAAGLLLFASIPARAADFPVKAAAPEPVWSWTGFYVGGNLGGGMASTHVDDPCLWCSFATPTGGFFTGGVQAGFNYQFGRGMVGLEADLGASSAFKGTATGGYGASKFDVAHRADVSGTIRARAGLVLDNTLLYVTGGAAWADLASSGAEIGNLLGTPGFGLPTGTTANARGMIWGGVIGAGIEYALGSNWTVGGEFLHTVYWDRGAGMRYADGSSVCGPFILAANCTIGTQVTSDVARLRLNYRFGESIVASAKAADTIRRTASVGAVYSWTGFYVGANAGGGLATSGFTDPCYRCSTVTPTGGFFTGGFQAGYNHQFGNGVVGLEADVNGNSAFKKSVLGGVWNQALAVGANADVSGTIRARAGVVVDKALLYVTGGAAWANVNQSAMEFVNRLDLAYGQLTGVSANASGVRWGSAWGAGVEYAIDANWTVGGDFLHTVFEDRAARITAPGILDSCLYNANTPNNRPVTNCVIRNQLVTDVARLRLNYRIGGAGDPANRYQRDMTAFDWSGLYLGGNAGGGMAASAFTDPCVYCAMTKPTGGFFSGGMQAGYNHQLGRGLIGIEADVNGNGPFKDSVLGGNRDRVMTVGLRADVSGTVRARAGLVVNNALAYVTGGAAWADVDQSGIDSFNGTNLANFGQPSGRTANARGVLWGGVIGAGVEYAINANWIVGGEFLHTVYRDRDAPLLEPNGASTCQPINPGDNCVVRGQLTTDVLRLRVNYKFGGSVPATY